MRFLVFADESSGGLEGVALSARLALGRTDEILVVEIVEPVLAAYGMGTGLGPAGTPLLPLAVLDGPVGGEELRARIRSALGGVAAPVRVMVQEGLRGRIVSRMLEATDADLVVVPWPPATGPIRGFLTGDPWRLIQATIRVPVLVAGAAHQTVSQVLVLLDDPALGADAVRALAWLPVPADARILVVGLPVDGSRSDEVRSRERMVRRTDVARGMLRRDHPQVATLVAGLSDQGVTELVERIDADLVVLAVPVSAKGVRLSGLARRIASRTGSSVLLIPSSASNQRRRAASMSRRRVPRIGTAPGATP